MTPNRRTRPFFNIPFSCWWPRCNVPLHCEHRFPGFNRNDNHSAWKTCSSRNALQRRWGTRYEQWCRHCHLSGRSSNDKWQPTIPAINTKHGPFGRWAKWCLMCWICWLSSSLNSITIFHSDRVNDCTVNSISDNLYRKLPRLVQQPEGESLMVVLSEST